MTNRHKIAGLIKVPQPLLSQTFDIIKDFYISSLYEEFKSIDLAESIGLKSHTRAITKWKEYINLLKSASNDAVLSYLSKQDLPDLNYQLELMLPDGGTIPEDFTFYFKIEPLATLMYKITFYTVNTHILNKTVSQEELIKLINTTILPNAELSLYNYLKAVDKYVSLNEFASNHKKLHYLKSITKPAYDRVLNLPNKAASNLIKLDIDPKSMSDIGLNDSAGYMFIRLQNGDDSVYLGQWDAKKDHKMLGVLTIYADITKNAQRILHNPNLALQLIKNKVQGLQETTHHELQHAIQSHISKKLHAPSIEPATYKLRGGLPSAKIRDLQYDPHGYEKGKPRLFKEKVDPSSKLSPQEKYDLYMEGKTIDEYGNIVKLHELRDVEFYTNLTTNIYNIKSVIKNLPTFLHNDYIKYWVDQITLKEFVHASKYKLREFILKNPSNKEYMSLYNNLKNQEHPAISIITDKYFNSFFVQLKKHEHKKYVKAVSEVIKELT